MLSLLTDPHAIGFLAGGLFMAALWMACEIRDAKTHDQRLKAMIDEAYARGRRRGLCEGTLKFFPIGSPDATIPPRH